MCRNIRVLLNFEPPTTHEEIEAAALQYVRKVTGTRKPAKANQAAFDRATREIAEMTRLLLDAMETRTPPRSREEERDKARARRAKEDAKRFKAPPPA